MLSVVLVLKRGVLDNNNSCILFIISGKNQIWLPFKINEQQTLSVWLPPSQIKNIDMVQSEIILNSLHLSGSEKFAGAECYLWKFDPTD